MTSYHTPKVQGENIKSEKSTVAISEITWHKCLSIVFSSLKNNAVQVALCMGLNVPSVVMFSK